MADTGAFTPSAIRRMVLPDAPLTSVRRAMTNLTKDGLLEKTELKAEGIYGRPEHFWKYKPVNG